MLGLFSKRFLKQTLLQVTWRLSEQTQEMIPRVTSSDNCSRDSQHDLANYSPIVEFLGSFDLLWYCRLISWITNSVFLDTFDVFLKAGFDYKGFGYEDPYNVHI